MTPKNAPGVPMPAGQPLPTVPDDMLDICAQDAGAGVSTDLDDQLLRLVTLVQANSPCADKRSEAFRAGAEPGRYRFHNDLDEFRDSFEAIFCGMQKSWVEWGPTRGSGQFGRHFELPGDTKTQVNQEGGAKRPQLVRSSGNVLMECREFAALVGGRAYLLALHGTGITVARQLQTYFGQLRHPKTNGILPSYAHKYLMTTTTRSNALGHWFVPAFQNIGAVSVAEFNAARELHAIVMRGAYRVETPAIAEEAA